VPWNMELGWIAAGYNSFAQNGQSNLALSWGRIGFDGVVGRAMASRAPGS